MYVQESNIKIKMCTNRSEGIDRHGKHVKYKAGEFLRSRYSGASTPRDGLGWTMDMSTQLLPGVVPVIDANMVR